MDLVIFLSQFDFFFFFLFWQHVKVLNQRKLEVVPQLDKSKFHFDLHTLKKMLPTVVVSVREFWNVPSVSMLSK